MTKEIRFTNPNQKAFLDLRNLPVRSESIPGTPMRIFVTDETPESLMAISDFHNNALVPVKDFVMALQAVKAELHAAKRGAR